jgi:hypothetical protein
MQSSMQQRTANPAPLRARRWPANRYYVSRQHRLLYCPIAKVACTSLKVWWAENECGPLVGEKSEMLRPNHDSHRQFTFDHWADELGDEPLDDPRWFRFTFVRNPWARLVSAFLNKFVSWNRIAPKLIDEFRRGLPTRMARQIVSPSTDNVLPPWWLFRSAQQWSEQFTFRQFVNHLTTCDLAQADVHWRPQSEFLGPFEFHFIGRFEQLDRDFDELLRRLGHKRALRQMNATKYSASSRSEECVVDWPLFRLRKLGAAPHYRRFYTPSLARTVGRLYYEDAEQFGYQFDQEVAVAASQEKAPAVERELAWAA